MKYLLLLFVAAVGFGRSEVIEYKSRGCGYLDTKTWIWHEQKCPDGFWDTKYTQTAENKIPPGAVIKLDKQEGTFEMVDDSEYAIDCAKQKPGDERVCGARKTGKLGPGESFVGLGLWNPPTECKEQPQLELEKSGCNEYRIVPNVEGVIGEALLQMFMAQSHLRIVALEKRVAQLEKKEPRPGVMKITKDSCLVSRGLETITCEDAGFSPMLNPHPFGSEPDSQRKTKD